MSATDNNINLDDLSSQGADLPSYVEVDPVDEDVDNIISDLVEIEEEAKSAAERDVELNRENLERELKAAVEQEIENNRRSLRATVYHNLSEHDENWDDYVDPAVAKNKIDELINRTKDVWIQRHLDDFIQAVNEHTDDSITSKDVVKYGIGVDVVRRVISNIASDTIQNINLPNFDVINWFIEETAFNPTALLDAVTALLRALLGV